MKRMILAAALGVALLAWTGAALAGSDLEDELIKVGQDYAIGYTSPLVQGFGPNQNANLFHTAAIPRTGLVFGIGVKAMGTYLAAEDQTFRSVKTNVDLGEYFGAGYAGQTGTVVMGGPTLFGDTETDGTIVGYVNGVQVVSQSTIPGLVDTRWVPMATPEAYIGGIAGLKVIVRYMPEINSDVGKVKYWGFGGQWNLNSLAPTLPVDVMIGYMSQKFEVGTLVEADATSLHLGVSKSLPALTVYGGFAKESSSMDVAYVEESSGASVAFSVDGRQETRFTLGVTFDFIAKLNVEMGHGDLTTYSAGLMFGM
ncbi:MAG TPA: hypothetical protein PLQ13_04410 [Candidatus Krumholzibacteria bacterium]|nr:hypothetical protein [Candidatus Krumholzibacteria bacterium]